MPKRPQKNPRPDKDPEPEPADNPDLTPAPGEAGSGAIAVLEKHQKKVVAITLLAALAIVGWLVMRQMGEQSRTAAAEAFSQAAAEGSVEKLGEVAEKYKGSVSGGNALLYKSEIQLATDKAEDALITLISFVNNYADHPRIAQGLFAIGNIHHISGDAEKAREYFDRALSTDPASEIAPLILIRQGDLLLEEADRLMADGKKEEAEAKKAEARTDYYEESYQRTEFRGGTFVALGREKLNLLALSEVPVVPAPPEPEPEPEPEKKPDGTPVVPAPVLKDGAVAPSAPAGPSKPDAGKGKGKPEANGKGKGKAKGAGTGKGAKNGKAAKPDSPPTTKPTPAPKTATDAPKVPKSVGDAPKAPASDVPKPPADTPKPE